MYNSTSRDLKAALDQVFRDVMLDVLQDSDVEKLQNYVKYSIEACRIGMITPTMPVVLLGDIFDAITLNKCEEMFTFVENGVHIWKEDLFFSSCKNNLLRMCNDLLRRLSRTQNTVFCGRILLFLAKFFPFSERSGLNIVSEFNLENITEYRTDTASSLKETIAELDTESEDKKFTIDFNLYCKFWALQDFFRNPNQCYNKVQWKTFVAVSRMENFALLFTVTNGRGCKIKLNIFFSMLRMFYPRSAVVNSKSCKRNESSMSTAWKPMVKMTIILRNF